MTISPDEIESGGEITIAIQDLQDNSTFTILIESTIDLDGETAFDLATANLQIPFTLRDGRIQVRAEPVTDTYLEVRKGNAMVQLAASEENGLVEDGVASLRHPFDAISAGTIDQLSVSGHGTDGAGSVSTSIELTGKKQGPDDSQITFGLGGVLQGSAHIITYVDGSQVLDKVITIGAAAPTPTQTTATPTQTSSPGGSPGGSGSVNPSPTPASLAVVSLDEIARITVDRESIGTGFAADQIRILSLAATSVPAEWQSMTDAYTLYPEGLTFASPAVLSIRMDDAVLAAPDAYTPFIARYDSGTWTMIPSRIQGQYITADITDAGTFAFMTLAGESAAPTPGQEQTAAPTTPPGASGTPADTTTPAAGGTSLPGMTAVLCLCGLLAAAFVFHRIKH
ncbi:hypothetical protein FGU65_05270 [Methanoculleus sp. FWC-SCC1]|uniref:PGF-pre-PGF domain-containing protein n=1 Tax=Methanoculleus frigidifontis TaxID=2584085 RepID=A0ABT8M8N9_9EURY|nr:hypothetical protein [Methanoculleus sp. FWC-SCC1]MDN7024307.1 hypothetical protein [Methanoculleus sp. FWC-SCC1]